MIDITQEWLTRYEWYTKLPPQWKQITYRLVRDLGASSFIARSTLIQALSAKDKDATLAALKDIDVSDVAMRLIEETV